MNLLQVGWVDIAFRKGYDANIYTNIQGRVKAGARYAATQGPGGAEGVRSPKSPRDLDQAYVNNA